MMKRTMLVVAALAFGLAAPAQALDVEQGDVIRAEYAYPTFGAPTLEPTSFLLQLSSADLFGDGDAVGVRYLDGGLTPLSLTRFDSSGAGLDATVGFTIDAADFLPGVLGLSDPPAVPSAGFVEIIAIAGSFDVQALTLFATEDVGASILRQVRVTNFEAVAGPQAAVPAPPAAPMLLAAMLGLAALRRRRR